MKQYTQTQYDSMLQSAKNELQNEKTKLIDEYSIYLNETLLEQLKDSLKLDYAIRKKEELENELSVFINENYPQTDYTLINGNVINTIETQININVKMDLFLYSKEFQELFKDFYYKLLT